MRAFAHLHLPRLLAHREGRGGPEVISYKIPGQPIEYRTQAHLRDVKFLVNQKGRQRALREGVRNVHAWVVGEPWTPTSAAVSGELRRAVYDPQRQGSFVDFETEEPLDSARHAWLVGDKVYYRP